jgi:hypothetical protein
MLVGGVSRERVDDVHVAGLTRRVAHWAPRARVVDHSAHVLEIQRVGAEHASDAAV